MFPNRPQGTATPSPEAIKAMNATDVISQREQMNMALKMSPEEAKIQYCLILQTIGGNLDAVRKMLESHPALILAKDIMGFPLLSVAVDCTAAENNVEMLKLLVKFGADLNPPSSPVVNRPSYSRVGSPLHNAVVAQVLRQHRGGSGDNFTMIEYLVRAGSDIDSVNMSTDDPYNPDLNHPSAAPPIPFTPLHFAVNQNRDDLALKLASLGADVDMRVASDVPGTRKRVLQEQSPLELAVVHNNPKMVECLLQKCGAKADLACKTRFAGERNRAVGKVYPRDTAVRAGFYDVVATFDRLTCCSQSRHESCRKARPSSGHGKLCSNCRSVFYCCVEHQKADWQLHRKRCKKIKKMIVLRTVNAARKKEDEEKKKAMEKDGGDKTAGGSTCKNSKKKKKKKKKTQKR